MDGGGGGGGWGCVGVHDETGKWEVRAAASGLVDGVSRGHPPGDPCLQTLVIRNPFCNCDSVRCALFHFLFSFLLIFFKLSGFNFT